MIMRGHTFKKRLLHFGLILIICSGCGIFQTRKPQSPLSGNGSTFIQPDDPTIVIQNLQNAIKYVNTQNYLRCLSSTGFEFQATSEAQNNYSNIWSGWSITNEQTYFNNLQAATQNSTGNQLQLTNTSFEIQSSTKQQYKANYTLTVIHNRAQSGVPTVASGQLIFILVQDDTGLWYIQSWTDISNSGGNSFTWSDLKAIFFKN